MLVFEKILIVCPRLLVMSTWLLEGTPNSLMNDR